MGGGDVQPQLKQSVLLLCHFTGGVGSHGTVQEVGDLSNSWKSSLDVQWDSGSSNRYRLGFDGKVDVHAVVESSAGFIYADHLPKLCKMRLSFVIISTVFGTIYHYCSDLCHRQISF